MKTYESEETLRKKLLEGASKLSKCVGSTLGPYGQTVLLKTKGQQPYTTKDGVTVVQFFNLQDPIEHSAVEIIRQSSRATGDKAGDGTTTTTVVAEALFRNGSRLVASGMPSITVQRSMDSIASKVTQNLRKMSTPITTREEIKRIATISANNDEELGGLIADAVDAAGLHGAITIHGSGCERTEYEVVDGYRIDAGYPSVQFVTDTERGRVYYEKPLIFVTNEEISTIDQIEGLVTYATEAAKPFIIVCADIRDQALAALVYNAQVNNMRGIAVKVPEYGELRDKVLNDLAVSTGAKFMDYKIGNTFSKLNNSPVKFATIQGMSESFECRKNFTVFYGGQYDEETMERHQKLLQGELSETENDKEAETLSKRIGRLSDSVVKIKIGGAISAEVTEKIHRADDALEAVRSATAEGFSPGGGTSLYKAASMINRDDLTPDEVKVLDKVVLPSLLEPLKVILSNSGLEEKLMYQPGVLDEWNKGLDMVSGEVVDSVERGILDPTKVLVNAIMNATSSAATLISTNYMVLENFTKEDK